LDSVFALPHERLPSGAFKTPASAANFTAAELRAHGQADAARAVLQRALDWLEARPAEEVREMGVFHGYWLARTLYKLERWEEARAAYETLLAVSPADTVALAALGAVAARAGDSERAQAISRQLAGKPGGQSLGRASIAALLGEREQAVELLREALHQIGTTGINRDWGWYMLQRHQDMDLESLRGYPPFELFMRPRG
jgi:tetratricopeptide (TPR) repeat protein